MRASLHRDGLHDGPVHARGDRFGAGEVSGPYDITSDGTNVYWTNYLSSGFVSKVTGATGAGYMTLASALSFPQDITNYKGVGVLHARECGRWRQAGSSRPAEARSACWTRRSAGLR